jgi:hypothetical protein
MLRELCDREEMREVKLTCLTTQLALFAYWRPRGIKRKESDIRYTREEWREIGKSRNIRQSVRLNLLKLIANNTTD